MERQLTVKVAGRLINMRAETNLGSSPHLQVPAFIKGRWLKRPMEELLQIHSRVHGAQDAIVHFEGRGYQITYLDREGIFYAGLIEPAPK